MSRSIFSLSKLVGVLVLAVASLSVYASDAHAPMKPKADAAKGEALYTNGDDKRGIIACSSCHGAAGNSTISTNPKLAAQHSAYLVKQLTEFTGAKRNNAVMTTFAKLLTAEDAENMAAYLSTQKPKQGTAKNKDAVDLGRKIYQAGIAAKNVPACAGCHGPAGAGIPVQYPRLAGQHPDYTVAQLNNFANGTRKNSDQMVAIAARMSESEMKAVAEFIVGLK